MLTVQNGDSNVVMRLVYKQEFSKTKDNIVDQSKQCKESTIGTMTTVNNKTVKKKAKKKKKKTSAATIRPQPSKTKRAKTPKYKTTPKKSVRSNKTSKFDNIDTQSREICTVSNKIILDNRFLQLLLGESKCHYVCHHRPSKAFVLVLKVFTTDQDTVAACDEKKENLMFDIDEKDNKTERDNSIITNRDGILFENVNSIDNIQSFLQWKKNVILLNNGRVLVQLSIDFKKKEIINSRIGYINIGENTCQIIGYDETRSMIVYDTLTTFFPEQVRIKF